MNITYFIDMLPKVMYMFNSGSHLVPWSETICAESIVSNISVKVSCISTCGPAGDAV